MQDIGDIHIYFVCDDREENEKLKEATGEKELRFSTKEAGNHVYHDLVETRRTLSECGVVVAYINQTFNYNTLLQYELAIAVLLEKDIAIVSDGTSLSPEFDYDFFCNINLNDNLRWVESLVESITGRCTRDKKTDVRRSRRDKLLQFTWNIEEEALKKQLDQRETVQNENDPETSEENHKVSHRLLCSLLTRSQENIATKVNQIPEEIRELCKRHQKMITKCHIRQIGRQLDLDDHQLDLVDTFYEHGIPEMFWQLVKIWHETFPRKVSARRLRKALQSCNINTEETHMPQKHKMVLTEMTDYLVNNIVDVDILMPQLISGNVLDDRTKPYVTAPRTRDQKSMRLLEVLETKEHGMFMIVEVFNKTGNQFLAEKIIDRLPELKEQTKQKPLLAVSPSPRSSCSSETSLKVFSYNVQFSTKEHKEQSRSLDRLHEFKNYSAPASLWTAIHSVPDDKVYILDTNESAKESLMQDTCGKSKQIHMNKKLCCVIS